MMDYLQKAKDYASMVAYSTKGDEYTFDQTGLEYFLDSLNIDFLAKPKKEWVGMTEDQRKQIIIDCEKTGDWGWEIDACKKIEAKLKEKNT